MSLRFYVLTSGKIMSLTRQFQTLPKDQTTVVINTLDTEYEFEAIGFCERNGIEWFATDSDGTPATGKNSVLKIFLESEYEYMVHVDGDDMITPYGKNLYRTVALDAPDVLCNYNEVSFKRYDQDLLEIFNSRRDSRTASQMIYFPAIYGARWPYSMDTRGKPPPVDYEAERYLRKIEGLDPKVALEWAQNSDDLLKWYERYNDRRNILNRIVFLSRKAAEMMWYDPCIKVGEDQVQFYKLKKLAYEGKIDMRVRNENPRYSYLYMQDDHSTTRTRDINYDWRGLLMDQLEILSTEMYPSDYHLPEYTDPYYEVNQ